MKIEEQEMAGRLVQWGKARDDARAMLLTSSRAIPGAPVDLLSDYDVILVVTDIHPLHDSRTWLGDFGPVLAVYRDRITPDDGLETAGYVTQYENGLKIDFTLWPVAMLRRSAAAAQLPDELDAGYRVLMDKDGLTGGLKTPTYRAFIPQPPPEAAFHEVLESFFLDTGYVARFLWRDDLMAAKHILDHVIKQDYLRPMLEWHAEIERGWTVKPGPYGRRLKQWLRPDLWAELEGTYTGLDAEANWQALFRSIALVRRAALEVGERLGYAYPHDLERRTAAYLEGVRSLERGQGSR